MIIALIGGSGCGKTTLARIASEKLDISVRHCGQKVRDAAAAIGRNFTSAPDHLHQFVDQQTRDWCAELKGVGVVEGRFLDRVLTHAMGVIFVELTATENERARRLTERLSRDIDEGEVRAMDQKDDLFRSRMYPGTSSAQGSLVIDTNGGTALECGQRLISIISQLPATERA